MTNLILKTTTEITDDELQQINTASIREFKSSLPQKEKLGERHFFFLKNDETILAMGQLLPIDPVILDTKQFSILGIGGIIANEQGKGYGKQIMTAIRSFLASHNKTGLGFCKLKNKGFYEKCGFITDTTSLHRLVYKSENEEMRADVENECLFYQDSSDSFMKQVLASSTTEVMLPTSPTW